MLRLRFAVEPAGHAVGAGRGVHGVVVEVVLPPVVLELAELEKEGVGDDVLGDGLKFLIQEAFLHCPRSAGQILMTLL